MDETTTEKVHAALEAFRIELPSWGFANTGTRFGKFIQPAAATTTEEKFSDAGQVHLLTGVCPTIALHVLWDLPQGVHSSGEIRTFAERYGVAPGSVNPNFFQDQEYKFGSFANPDAAIRQRALKHARDSIEIATRLHSRDISFWFADGSNYPGTANIRQRRRWFEEALQEAHGELAPDQRMLIEYKPFEPAFYHTDIADWGMALLLTRAAGPQTKVLVDTGHHYAAQNIEQIVVWLLSEGMLGGFHFNDRRYADDDLTLGSIDPYQVFRIFHEIQFFERETGARADIAYMVDQSHNLKGKMEADDSDRHHGPTTLCQGCPGRRRETGDRTDQLRSGARRITAAGCFCHRRSPRHPGLAPVQGSAQRSHGSVSAERISGTHHQRARRQEFPQYFFVCLVC